MHAVVAIFEMDRPNAQQEQFLREGIVARVSQEPGFVAGYWTHDGTFATNMLIFDSLETAELRAADVRGNAVNQEAAGIRPVQITVAEVVAHAVAPIR